ncbi:hypothetical protein J2S59_001363 [Nocardioides massiliensis]|uniref:Uncharacterized protein n=1 Tax=Nocardioides massiliensis TaxID=1325935 RepID=A0ABT9NMA6_9ACTN|nr:hypothetical protein [Nocardioides massiliensis]
MPAACGGRGPPRLGGRVPPRLGGRVPPRLGGRVPVAVGGRVPVAVGGRVPDEALAETGVSRPRPGLPLSTTAVSIHPSLRSGHSTNQDRRGLCMPRCWWSSAGRLAERGAGIGGRVPGEALAETGVSRPQPGLSLSTTPVSIHPSLRSGHSTNLHGARRHGGGRVPDEALAERGAGIGGRVPGEALAEPGVSRPGAGLSLSTTAVSIHPSLRSGHSTNLPDRRVSVGPRRL